MVKDFRDFILQGNVVDLAVAVVIGAAFGAVVTALVADLITPLIAAIGGQPDFSGLRFTVNSSTFRYGEFLNAVISFLVIAAAVFFRVVVPVNRLMALHRKPSDPMARDCPYCMSSVAIAATRCAYCTSDIPSAAGAPA